MKSGKIFVYTGPSGAGKTTIAEKVLKLKLFKRIITCTTRAPRKGEVDGKDYHFISRKEFEERIKNNEFFEHAEVYGNYYGSLKSEVDYALTQGKSVLMVVDIQGAQTIKKNTPSAVTIFISAPTIAELKKRLLKRGKDSPEALEKRLKLAAAEMKTEKSFDYLIVNDVLSIAIKEAKEIIKTELAKN